MGSMQHAPECDQSVMLKRQRRRKYVSWIIAAASVLGAIVWGGTCVRAAGHGACQHHRPGH